MPDGDFHHSSLDKKWKRSYGALCEGHWTAAELGYKVLHPLKEQLQQFGNMPIAAGMRVADILEEANQAGDIPARASDLQELIDDTMCSVDLNCSPRGRDLMHESLNQMLTELESGTEVESARESVVKIYAEQVYRRQFEERLQKTAKHHADATFDDIENQKQAIRPYVNRGIENFSQQIARSESVNQLRRLRSMKAPILTIDDAPW